jgi:hypothetical protein
LVKRIVLSNVVCILSPCKTQLFGQIFRLVDEYAVVNVPKLECRMSGWLCWKKKFVLRNLFTIKSRSALFGHSYIFRPLHWRLPRSVSSVVLKDLSLVTIQYFFSKRWVYENIPEKHLFSSLIWVTNETVRH